MTEYKHGDIFAIELSDEEYAFGRIMLDVEKQCLNTKLIDADAQLSFYNKTVLVDIYKETANKPEPVSSEALINGIFVGKGFIANGMWPIVGYEEVSPKDVDFPENLAFENGSNSKFIKGEVTIIIPLDSSEMEKIDLYPNTSPPIVLSEIILYHLGRKDEINNPAIEDVEIFNLKNKDLRYSEHRDRIYELLGEDMHQSYYELAAKHGYDIARFYDRKNDE